LLPGEFGHVVPAGQVITHRTPFGASFIGVPQQAGEGAPLFGSRA